MITFWRGGDHSLDSLTTQGGHLEIVPRGPQRNNAGGRATIQKQDFIAAIPQHTAKQKTLARVATKRSQEKDMSPPEFGGLLGDACTSYLLNSSKEDGYNKKERTGTMEDNNRICRETGGHVIAQQGRKPRTEEGRTCKTENSLKGQGPWDKFKERPLREEGPRTAKPANGHGREKRNSLIPVSCREKGRTDLAWTEATEEEKGKDE